MTNTADDSAATWDNESSGVVHGHLVQTGQIHGPVHINSPSEPPQLQLDDASLDAPRLNSPIRGRGDLLDELTGALESPGGDPHVLHGLGGCGKTALAQAVAKRASDRGVRVFWVRSDNVVASMLWVAVELGAPMAEAAALRRSPQRAPGWVWRWLDTSEKPWLLVFDNADRPTELGGSHRPGDADGWVRGSRAGMTLVTTRSGRPDLWSPAQLHEVTPLTPEDAVSVLQDSADPGNPTAPARLPDTAWSLAQRLGGIPLALHLVGRLLREYPLVVPNYAAALDLARGSLADIDELTHPFLRDYHPERAQRLLLSRVWELSLKLFNGEVPQARPLLAVLSLLGPDGLRVPTRRLDLATLRGSAVDNGPKPLTMPIVNRAVTSLVSHGLADLRTGNEEQTLGVHPVVSEVTRQNLGEQAAGIASLAHDLLEHREGTDLAVERMGYRAVLLVRKECLGAEHPDTLRTRHRLAWLLARSGELEESQRDYESIVSIRQRVLGAAHPDTLAVRRGLAWVQDKRGELGAAESGYRSVLEIQQRELGREHPSTLRARQALAWLKGRRGDFDAAEADFREVLQARETALGIEHPDTLATRLGLAWTAEQRGDLETARGTYRSILNIRKRVLGDHHPDTLKALHAVAWITERRGDTEAAGAGYREVLELQERVLGDRHPDTELTRRNLAELLSTSTED